jgi:ubiquinone/menaquinone biosynthesis C-methylase UbiE
MHPAGLAGRLFGFTMDVLNHADNTEVLRLLALKDRDRFVEIGFGTGALLKRADAMVGDGSVAGVDPSELMLETAKRRVVGDLRLGTAAELPWPDATFDAAAAVHCFQFFADPVHDLREIRRVLRPGGRLVLCLRMHRGRRTELLPNPLSRQGDEVANAEKALGEAGFAVKAPVNRKRSSPTILASPL